MLKKMQGMNSDILKIKPQETNLKLQHDNRYFSYLFKGTTF